MKKILFTLLFSALFLTLNSCIAMKNDVDMAKSELRAENTAKMKILEENVTKDVNQSLKDEVDKLNARLDEIEKSQKNRMELLFNNIEELRKSIQNINNRIDSFDIKAGKSSAVAEQLAVLEKKITENKQELLQLREDLNAHIENSKPVNKITVTKDGIIRFPENPETSYNQLVDLTKSEKIDPATTRKIWEAYSNKWPESRKCDVTFWTGETYFMEKSYNKAIETLQPIERNYPGCVKIENSYLKIAFSLFYTGKVDVANAVLQTMKEKFPQSAFPDKVKELEKLIQSKMPKKTAPAKKAEPPKKAPAKQQTKTPAKTKK